MNAVGEAATLQRVLPDAAEIGQRIDTPQAGSRRRPVLVVACDGAHAATRPSYQSSKTHPSSATRFFFVTFKRTAPFSGESLTVSVADGAGLEYCRYRIRASGGLVAVGRYAHPRRRPARCNTKC